MAHNSQRRSKVHAEEEDILDPLGQKMAVISIAVLICAGLYVSLRRASLQKELDTCQARLTVAKG